ncbi:MAG: VirB3 family type IV secretion system protein [Hyphomicrobiales bacterium]|nr:VirB3 family type IV secretion system protein [Hyphomicrobiales bacterium]MDE2115810.1 VirB3 family type IV secretion system protein [Hyphomicrobiales bacterium]
MSEEAFETPLVTPLVRALTVAPTLLGVPYLYFMFLGVVSSVVFLATKNLLMLLVALPLYAFGRIMVARDLQIFEILMIRGAKCPPRSKAFWHGASSYKV